MTLDQFKRPLRDLRISVTDRCNFRCGYCMPAERTYTFLPRNQLLQFEEITQLASVFAELGVQKLRLTGGEPLLRRDLPVLIQQLSQIPGIQDIALTTNGFSLAERAAALKDAGVHRITVSLDTLTESRFPVLSGTKVPLAQVQAGIAAAADLGFPIKINMVVQKGINDDEIPDMVSWCRERGYTPRFIEFMDVGNVNGWKMERVLPAAEVLARVQSVHPSEPIQPAYSGEVARRHRFADGQGEFGLITSVTQPFCGDCSRARLSAQGKLFTCLFATQGYDLRQRLREDGLNAVREEIAKIWSQRTDRYSEIRGSQDASGEKVEMFHIGG